MKTNSIWRIAAVFFAARMILLLSLPMEGLRGYGDYWNFYHLASLGWPYFDLWVEFPPVFPFFSALLYQFAGGRQHTYEYLLAISLSLVQAGSVAQFARLAIRLRGAETGLRRAGMYALLLVGLFYGWGYFDPLAVLGMLWGVNLLLDGRDLPGVVALSLGALTKWIPALGVITAWWMPPPKRAARISALVAGFTLGVYALLYALSPDMTAASLRAQFGRPAWETVWALAEGNLATGNLGPGVDHLDPLTASRAGEYSVEIPSWLTLVPFAGLGGWLFLRQRSPDGRARVAFWGVTLGLFFLWSPGWSPQWVLYLLPLILLLLPERQAGLMALVWVLVSLLEWPLLLSRGYFQALWLLAPLRAVLLALLVIEFWQVTKIEDPTA